MLRIHFTSTDLARTHLAEGPDPLWETVFSLQMLQARYGRLAFAEWRQRVRVDLRRHGLASETRGLRSLVPDASYFPDFLTPPEGLLGMEAGIEAIVAAPPARVAYELGILRERVGAPTWAQELADRTPRARERLGRMLSGYHARAVAPYWSAIRRRTEADRAIRTRTLRTAGVEGLLDGFRPAMRWSPPVLEIPGYPLDRDLYLEERGLLLVPSHFCWGHPVSFADAELPPTLLYPLGRDPGWMHPVPSEPGHLPLGLPVPNLPPPDLPAADPLARLLGSTRAAVLRAASAIANTRELARHTGITPAAASQHTAVLREAGLITSRRHANSVFHQPTQLGAALLRRHQVGPETTRRSGL
ncbi:MAG TPA: helix-turn-helix domain-containing protein [Streptosporangiaceae bacterium]|jgi:DNA-binding transcriptional ArsR family regulator|nr:helix-turn-helix domain-containing protein [Streptosporangiaceae bacterium]